MLRQHIKWIYKWKKTLINNKPQRIYIPDISNYLYKKIGDSSFPINFRINVWMKNMFRIKKTAPNEPEFVEIVYETNVKYYL